eukprot:12932825-Prorocentrum_lima.AAC.1
METQKHRPSGKSWTETKPGGNKPDGRGGSRTGQKERSRTETQTDETSTLDGQGKDVLIAGRKNCRMEKNRTEESRTESTADGE